MTRTGRLLGATALGVLAWATLVEPRLFTIRRGALPVLPEGAAPLRVLQLSDLHLAPWQHRKIEWIRSLAELRPDLLVLTGDLLGHSRALGPLLHALEPFRGVPGVFVHGSNDYYGPIVKNPFRYLSAPSRLSTREQDLDNAALTRGLVELGLIDLNNAAARLEFGGSTLEIFGLGDPHIRYDDPAEMQESLRALPRRRKKVGPLRLGVVHAPYQSALNALLDEDPALILAGHTHGGQVRVPGIGALTANCDLPVRQARGLSVWYDAERASYLNVSAGLGGSIYAPVRFACRPEASLLTLEPAD
ncbi:metallophosphoesterase [Leucobacter weissii]|uniref:Metallophosphoesterase n=1 Tax=Leucobacter weissii TaxID=1983706 RepID=A0A939SBN7_9MICO|nr:metallophosphoesterase [Leucobacter weissii]MBO1901615.1 metallophosphoesterase [Leucobacter weissii]